MWIVLWEDISRAVVLWWGWGVGSKYIIYKGGCVVRITLTGLSESPRLWIYTLSLSFRDCCQADGLRMFHTRTLSVLCLIFLIQVRIFFFSFVKLSTLKYTGAGSLKTFTATDILQHNSNIFHKYLKFS